MPETSAKITEETEVKTTELATVLGVTARRVQQMAQDGTLPTSRKGYFRLGESVQKYIKFVSDGPMDEERQKIDRIKSASEASMKQSKSKMVALELAELQGKMHRAEDVKAITDELVYTIRGALMALPGRLAVNVAAAESPSEAAEVIKKEVFKVLRELAAFSYDPQKYAERVRDRQNWDGTDEDEDE